MNRSAWSIRRVVVLATMLVVPLTLAPTTLADTDRGTVGVVGAHHLLDTLTSPGATCHFKTTYGGPLGWEGKLRRVDVVAPVVFGIGSDLQKRLALLGSALQGSRRSLANGLYVPQASVGPWLVCRALSGPGRQPVGAPSLRLTVAAIVAA